MIVQATGVTRIHIVQLSLEIGGRILGTRNHWPLSKNVYLLAGNIQMQTHRFSVNVTSPCSHVTLSIMGSDRRLIQAGWVSYRNWINYLLFWSISCATTAMDLISITINKKLLLLFKSLSMIWCACNQIITSITMVFLFLRNLARRMI